MKNSLYKKNFVIGIVTLFVIMSVFPVVNATAINGQTQAQVELNVVITKPAKGHLYINDEDQGNTATGATWIIGRITIEASASGGDGGIARVEFWISEINRSADNEPPYEWLWNDTAVGTITIKVKAFDTAGNEASKSLNVRVIMNLNAAGIETMAVAETMMAEAVTCGDMEAGLASSLILNSNNLATDAYQTKSK